MDNIAYNKRQFWEYKKLKGTKINTETNTNTNNKTIKQFHIINNKVATDKILIKRLSNIYIPPAYKHIIVAKSPNNKIQAIGTDKRGRRQYIYNPIYTNKRNERKYDNISELAKKIGKIEIDNDIALKKLNKYDIDKWKLPDDYIPIIIYMLRVYHFRIGCERYVNDNKSHGITTLHKTHIHFHTPTSFSIEFIGKKGILNKCSDNNPLIAKLLHKLVNGSVYNNGFLFKYMRDGVSNFITPDHIQTFFQDNYKAYITPKMFRTWYANYHTLMFLRKMFNEGQLQPHITKKDKYTIVKKCSEYVSKQLNNTPNVSKQSYIDNKILGFVMRNPYNFARKIPDDTLNTYKFLHKIMLGIA